MVGTHQYYVVSFYFLGICNLRPTAWGRAEWSAALPTWCSPPYAPGVERDRDVPGLEQDGTQGRTRIAGIVIHHLWRKCSFLPTSGDSLTGTEI